MPTANVVAKLRYGYGWKEQKGGNQNTEQLQ